MPVHGVLYNRRYYIGVHGPSKCAGCEQAVVTLVTRSDSCRQTPSVHRRSPVDVPSHCSSATNAILLPVAAAAVVVISVQREINSDHVSVAVRVQRRQRALVSTKIYLVAPNLLFTDILNTYRYVFDASLFDVISPSSSSFLSRSPGSDCVLNLNARCHCGSNTLNRRPY